MIGVLVHARFPVLGRAGLVLAIVVTGAAVRSGAEVDSRAH